MGQKQAVHRYSGRQASGGRFSHGVDIMGNDNPLFPCGKIQNFGIALVARPGSRSRTNSTAG